MNQEKKANQKKMKKVTVIANEHQYKLDPFIKKCSSSHKETLTEFIYETGINVSIDNVFRASSQELAYELVEQGFCVLLYSSQVQPTNLTVYLPEKLSDEQRKYLQLATSMVTECDLIVFTLNSKEEVFVHQVRASKNVELLLDYISALPEFKVDGKTTTNSNKKIKAPQKFYPSVETKRN